MTKLAPTAEICSCQSLPKEDDFLHEVLRTTKGVPEVSPKFRSETLEQLGGCWVSSMGMM